MDDKTVKKNSVAGLANGSNSILENNEDMNPLRCARCGRFLGMEKIERGTIYIKCPNCKNWVVVVGYMDWDEIVARRQEEGPDTCL